jgi:hypothetical protein
MSNAEQKPDYPTSKNKEFPIQVSTLSSHNGLEMKGLTSLEEGKMTKSEIILGLIDRIKKI